MSEPKSGWQQPRLPAPTPKCVRSRWRWVGVTGMNEAEREVARTFREALSQANFQGLIPDFGNPNTGYAQDQIAAWLANSEWLARHDAALLASRDARLATFEALADEKHEPPIDLIHERCPAGGVGPGRECTACSAAGRAYLIGVEHVQRDLRAALRSDPDEASTDA